MPAGPNTRFAGADLLPPGASAAGYPSAPGALASMGAMGAAGRGHAPGSFELANEIADCLSQRGDSNK